MVLKIDTFHANRWARWRLAMACAVVGAVAVTAAAEDDSQAKMDPYVAARDAQLAFDEGQFDAALKGYEAAAGSLGESQVLDYNRAAALYKLGDYKAAAELLSRAALSAEADMGLRSQFAWGNCDYSSALSKIPEGDPAQAKPEDNQAAIELLQSATRHYRDALAAESALSADHPADRATRGNIERASRLIRRIEEVMEQQQSEQQSKQQDDQDQEDQQDKKKQQEQEQDQQQGDQEQEDQQEKSDQEQESDSDEQESEQSESEQDSKQDPSDEQKNEQQQDPSQDQQQQQDDMQQAKADQAQEQELSQEQLESILQSVRDKEKRRRDEKRKMMRARRVPVLRDW